MSGEEQLSAKIDKLAGVAKDANLVTAVAELQGQLVHFIDRETRAYKAQAGDGWTDQVWRSIFGSGRRKCAVAAPATSTRF
jgi:hypothetical protein